MSRSSCAPASSGVSPKKVTNSSAPGSPWIVSAIRANSRLERESSRIVESIISIAAASSASASSVAAIAASTESKCPTANIFAFGSSISPTVASVIATSVPSEPVTKLREVELAREAVEPVAAGLAPVLRVVLGDRAGVVAQDLRQPAVDRALERVGLAPAAPARPRRPGRSARSSRRRARPRARGRGRSSCRRRSSGCRRSCCRSCRRAWPGWRSRCRGRSRGRGGRRRG